MQVRPHVELPLLRHRRVVLSLLLQEDGAGVLSRKKNPGHRTLTLHLEPEDSYAIDNYSLSFGLESRSGAALALLRAGISGVPLETFEFEVLQLGVKETRKAEFEALANFYSERAAMFRSGR